MSAEAFVAAARGLIGAQWRHRGRKSWAVDCIGLVVLSGRKAGLTDVREEPALYGREPWDDRLRQECRARWGEPVAVKDAQPGDVLLVRWGKGDPSHIAIAGDNPDGGLTVIHAHSLHGVTEQSMRGAVAEAVIEAYRPSWGDAA